jgi:hypothetical protein
MWWMRESSAMTATLDPAMAVEVIAGLQSDVAMVS